jgi:hypothetical protein
MASENTMTTLNGWFKTSYADKVKDLAPENLYYCKECKPLEVDKRPGGDYTIPVTVTSEQGITKAASSAGAFALNAPIAMGTTQASIAGSQLLLRSALDYETIFRSKNKNSFIAATKGVVKNMLKSSYFYLEADSMWGKSGIGIVSSISGNTITLTTASFASGLWLGSENRRLRIETSGGVLRGTCSVSSYDIGARTVTVDSAPAGVAGTDVIYFEADGASGANSMTGIYKMITDTTGTLFGINRASYNLWKSAGTYNASGALSFAKIMKALTQGANKGLGDEVSEIDIVVNPGAWTDLGNDLATLRTIDSSYKSTQAENGAEALVFHSQVGKVKVIPHKLMKEGFAFVHPKASRGFEYAGTVPTPTFDLPGKAGKSGEYLREMENNAGVETRLYWNNAVFTDQIAGMVVVNGIVNS